ncbi:MAG: hypothetical protein J5I53_05215 [Bradyrhizobiaceae bacterium]|nr:hypothetical protein [Bradyrhizobiaceae bacterium]
MKTLSFLFAAVWTFLLFPVAGAGAVVIPADSTTDADQVQTLIPGGKIESGGFGALVLKVGEMNNKVALGIGGRGGWVINRTFVLGGGGYAFTDATVFRQADVDTSLAFSYGGLEMEYLLRSNELVHFTFMSLFGAGAFNVFRMMPHDDDFRGTSLYTAACFVLEPAVNIEVNILSWLRLSAGVGYRFVTGIDATIGNEHYTNSTVSGFYGSGTIKFGPY